MKKYDLINGAAAREEALRLLTPDELVTMNLFELIFSFPEASAWTDHESFIIGQSNEKTPIWMWLSERCGSESLLYFSACLKLGAWITSAELFVYISIFGVFPTIFTAFCRGFGNDVSVNIEPRPMTGTIPGICLPVPFQFTVHMRALVSDHV